ncbi:hypothetical protein [Actinomadura sp. HBU206391]|uniref:hypothetical protein n=1 Tax=Actinomadura sp. HBU206391 TaxID=2731692 RepID=UPI002905CDFA|nr:hypothetical protein [Actinomadura sp. HBU206391]
MAAVLLALPLAGAKGAVGAAIATVVVVAFFTISHVAVGYAAKVSPQTMMLAAMSSYVLKILAVMLLISVLNNVTIWNPKVFAWTVLALIATWIGGEIRTTLKSRTPYVDDPDKTPDDAASSVPETPADRSG